ncbi:hypothetical protein GDO81_017697 [Engystomops pustulosus]|uniref:Uncharacterized protein n=1 Tax=Engystomops pustulosus TaxID=76066 RepID=A0AAV7A5A4_ENGPU|nr:hypothetical protein GDO81_017697 [Engystomops pustulosus]
MTVLRGRLFPLRVVQEGVTWISIPCQDGDYLVLSLIVNQRKRYSNERHAKLFWMKTSHFFSPSPFQRNSAQPNALWIFGLYY